jgi:outer membrane protein assembly factor BamB
LLVFSVVLSACAKSKKTDFFEVEEPPKKPKVVTKTKLDRNWRIDLGSKIRAGDAIISPALSGDFIYAASTNGKIFKVSADSGKKVWQNKFKKEKITAGVSVGGGLVLVATDQGMVYALDQADGQISWKVRLSSEVLASPVIDGDVVVARTGDGKVYGLSAFDGEVLWTISRQLPKLTLRGESKPLMIQGVVFTGFPDGTLAAVEAKNGRALWDFPISFARGTNELDRLSDIDTTPLLVGNHIYVSSYQSITHALNIEKQSISWSSDVSSFLPLSYDAAHLYITDKRGVVHQLGRSDGIKQWSQDGLRLRDLSSPIAIKSFILVGDGEGGLYVMSKTDGRYIGKHKLGAKRIVGETLVDDNNVYLIDSDGNLQSFKISNRSE